MVQGNHLINKRKIHGTSIIHENYNTYNSTTESLDTTKILTIKNENKLLTQMQIKLNKN